MARDKYQDKLLVGAAAYENEKAGPDMGKVIKDTRGDTKAGIAKAKAAEARNRDRSRYVTEGENINGTRIADYADVAPKKKASKPAITKLKDTSKDYWSADGLSGDMGSASGETGANMGQVNKGGYDADSDGMKRGGKVKKMAGGGSASARADGCCIKGKTKGTFV